MDALVKLLTLELLEKFVSGTIEKLLLLVVIVKLVLSLLFTV